ncbi:MAG: hypothetical protein RBR34_01855 [Rhodospirillaceae bacterium]|nr:hypothetical protein [Rhodospirillaceae bacterium]
MNKHSMAAIMLCGVLSVPMVAQAGPSCFTESEARAAHFRILQQEFNVAALNCRSIDPKDSSIASRYNVLVSRIDAPLRANAQTLKGHFSRAGLNFDRWMTQVANDAGQRVMNDPSYCQRASDILDQALVSDPFAVEDLAVRNISHHLDVSVCATPEIRSAEAKPKAKAAKQEKKVASAAPANQ